MMWRFLFSILIFFAISSNLSAQKIAALRFFSSDSSLFYLHLDSVKINKTPSDTVTASNLTQLFVDVKIQFKNKKSNRLNYQLYPKKGFTTSYAIKHSPDTCYMLWFGEEILQYSKFEEAEISAIDSIKHKTKRESIDETIPLRTCASAMIRSDFEIFRTELRKIDFESDKYIFARNLLKTQCLSSEQVRQTAGSFDFEDTKIDFIKLAFDFTTDTQNYNLVYDCFDFSDSITEIETFRKAKK